LDYFRAVVARTRERGRTKNSYIKHQDRARFHELGSRYAAVSKRSADARRKRSPDNEGLELRQKLPLLCAPLLLLDFVLFRVSTSSGVRCRPLYIIVFLNHYIKYYCSITLYYYTPIFWFYTILPRSCPHCPAHLCPALAHVEPCRGFSAQPPRLPTQRTRWCSGNEQRVRGGSRSKRWVGAM